MQFVIFYPCDATLARYLLSLRVLPSVTSQSCSKTAKYRIEQTTLHDGYGTRVSWSKNSLRNSENASVIGKYCIFRPLKFVSIRHGRPRPRRCAGGGIRGVINNSGGSRTWWSHVHSYGPVDINKVDGTGVCSWHQRHRTLAVAVVKVLLRLTRDLFA